MKNVILLFADDMRYGMVENPEIYTPNLESLASKGIMYTNAHIPGGTSGAVCMPSRAMLHTGRLLEGLSKAGRNIPKAHALLGETLLNNNYDTYGIGKWHNGTDSFSRSFNGGAEIFFGGMEDHWNVPANNYDPTGKYDKTIFKCQNTYLSNSTSEYSCDHITAGKHSSDLFADASIDFLNTREKGDKPFLLYTAFMAPHDPRTMPAVYKDMYDPEKITLPKNYMPLHPFDFGVSGIRDELLAPYPREETEIRRHLCDYYAMVTHLDANIGRIMDSLEKTGLSENTIVIFAADNGLAVGSHGLMGKQNLYEHSIRVPLILCGPGIPRKTRSDTPVLIADLYPTILEMLGLDVPSTCTALSFFDNIRNGIPSRSLLKLRYKNYILGIKKDGFKLIKYMLADGNRFSLYDLKNDPDEINDLATNKSYASIKNALLAELNLGWKTLEIS